MTPDDLAQMSREELIELVLAEHAELEALRADYEALKMKLEKGRKPPTNSSNSSQPPSRDQKPNAPKDRRKHRTGRRTGIQRTSASLWLNRTMWWKCGRKFVRSVRRI